MPDGPHKSIPFPPMEAELVRELPEGDGWQYEPKWDGFRGVLENVGKELALWSRNGRPLLRYFPELRPLGELLPPKTALDGEVVIVRDGALDFDAMQMRLHPAESRIKRLSARSPPSTSSSTFCSGTASRSGSGRSRSGVPSSSGVANGFRLSPAVRDLKLARGWLDRFEALGLDGVIAKRLGVPYLPGSRDGVVKVKEHKTADCVVVGMRWKGDREAIATLLLGLYREDGGLDYVGSCAVAASMRKEVAARVLPLLEPSKGERVSEPNRWGTGELEEAPVKPKLVDRGALRQGAGLTLPPRHEVHPLARRQGSELMHLARAARRRRARERRGSVRFKVKRSRPITSLSDGGAGEAAGELEHAEARARLRAGRARKKPRGPVRAGLPTGSHVLPLSSSST